MRRRAAPQRMTTNLTADGQLAGGSPAAYLPGAQGGPGSAGMGGGPMGGAVPGHNPLAVHGGGMPARNGGMGGGPLARPMQMGARPAGGGPVAAPIAKPVASNEPKVGRNDPCWCGSGKKFKKCHGA
ncbi:MAG TPA: SEC-C metal-binding domain-containing protein [Bdellovibrionota bacterium]|nr:SEC-C metal-binding domain-containing protein [Bdellovibrionota bacterium]